MNNFPVISSGNLPSPNKGNSPTPEQVDSFSEYLDDVEAAANKAAKKDDQEELEVSATGAGQDQQPPADEKLEAELPAEGSVEASSETSLLSGTITGELNSAEVAKAGVARDGLFSVEVAKSESSDLTGMLDSSTQEISSIQEQGDNAQDSGFSFEEQGFNPPTLDLSSLETGLEIEIGELDPEALAPDQNPLTNSVHGSIANGSAPNSLAPMIQDYISTAQTVSMASSTQASLAATATVGNQVAAVFTSQLNSFDKEPVQTLSLELHPAELGRLTIRVEHTPDQLSAQIFANEVASSDLLLKEKDFLLEALANLGFGETSLDISHGQPDNTGSESRNASPNSLLNIQDTENQNTSPTLTTVGAIGINLVA